MADDVPSGGFKDFAKAVGSGFLKATYPGLHASMYGLEYDALGRMTSGLNSNGNPKFNDPAVQGLRDDMQITHSLLRQSLFYHAKTVSILERMAEGSKGKGGGSGGLLNDIEKGIEDYALWKFIKNKLGLGKGILSAEASLTSVAAISALAVSTMTYGDSQGEIGGGLSEKEKAALAARGKKLRPLPEEKPQKLLQSQKENEKISGILNVLDPGVAEMAGFKPQPNAMGSIMPHMTAHAAELAVHPSQVTIPERFSEGLKRYAASPVQMSDVLGVVKDAKILRKIPGLATFIGQILPATKLGDMILSSQDFKDESLSISPEHWKGLKEGKWNAWNNKEKEPPTMAEAFYSLPGFKSIGNAEQRFVNWFRRDDQAHADTLHNPYGALRGNPYGKLDVNSIRSPYGALPGVNYGTMTPFMSILPMMLEPLMKMAPTAISALHLGGNEKAAHQDKNISPEMQHLKDTAISALHLGGNEKAAHQDKNISPEMQHLKDKVQGKQARAIANLTFHDITYKADKIEFKADSILFETTGRANGSTTQSNVNNKPKGLLDFLNPANIGKDIQNLGTDAKSLYNRMFGGGAPPEGIGGGNTPQGLGGGNTPLGMGGGGGTPRGYGEGGGGTPRGLGGGNTPHGRVGGSRSWRNNNPGNLKYGKFAATHGAVGQDNNGFAIFPNEQAGIEAQSNLLFNSDTYKGLNVGQAISKYAPSSENDVKAYDKAISGAGIDLSAPMSSLTKEQRTKMLEAMKAHEGWRPGNADARDRSMGTGGNDKIIPGSILAKAREAALTGGPGAVQRFMASQGYPVNGNWCGEFASAVVHAAGGTPPKGSAIASNWRNWGDSDKSPHAGDIAVRRGVPTGSTGSHVTFVEGIDPKTGHFTGVGGNQGRPEENFPTSNYDFRKAPPPIEAKSVSPLAAKSVSDAKIQPASMTPGSAPAYHIPMAPMLTGPTFTGKDGSSVGQLLGPPPAASMGDALTAKSTNDALRQRQKSNSASMPADSTSKKEKNNVHHKSDKNDKDVGDVAPPDKRLRELFFMSQLPV